MSKAFDNFDFTPEAPPPFWRPFCWGMLFATPASLLWYELASRDGMRLPGMCLLIGVLCAIGTRVGNGDYFSTFVATLIQIGGSISLITLYLLAARLGQPLAETAVQVLLQGHLTDFCNECVVGSGQTGIRIIPFAFLVAYEIQDRD